jgi:hypothetical protein
MISYNQILLEDKNFSALNINTKTLSGIYIYYNNSGLHDIMSSWPFYSPTPIIDISYDFENTNNIPDSLKTTINLEGIIYTKKNDTDTTSYSFDQMILAMNNLRKIFTDKPYGSLEIKSVDSNNSEQILNKLSGLSLQNISFNPTEDNWTKSIKYSVSLEGSSSLYSGIDDIERYVTDRVHTWNIEPIEDFYYTDSITSLVNRQGSEINNPISPPSIAVRDFQQFRVTRKISAKGRSGRSLDGPDNVSGQGLLQANTRPYIFAKAWVEKMGSTFMTNPNTYNSQPFFASLSNSSTIKTYPFDHKRTVNIDIFEGTYSIDDSWIVLPRANPYIETYTIENSTDENFIKTVSVQGDIIGLSIYQDPMNIVAIGTGVNAKLVGSQGSLITNFDSSLVNVNSGLNYSVLDSNTPITRPSIKRSKYENSLSGWLYDIKPYLYRRASLAINTEDRTLPRTPQNRFLPPNNPIYSKENFLSVTPISATENHDPFKGSINYNYTFNNRLNIFGNVISENVSISYENSANNIVEISTLNADLSNFAQRSHRTNPTKNITVNISILPATNIDQISMNNPACPLHTGQWLWSTINQFILAHAPYSEKKFPLGAAWNTNIPGRGSARLNNLGIVFENSDNETWNPTTGQYSRSYSWIYQPHTIINNHRDH